MEIGYAVFQRPPFRVSASKTAYNIINRIPIFGFNEYDMIMKVVIPHIVSMSIIGDNQKQI